MTHLVGQVGAGQAQGLALGEQVDKEFVGGVAGAVADVVDPGVARQFGGHFVGGLAQGVEVRVHQVEGDVGAEAGAIGGTDRQHLDPVGAAGGLAPALFDRRGVQAALVLLAQLHHDAASGAGAAVGKHVLHQFFIATAFRAVVRLHLFQGRDQVVDDLQGARLGRALEHLHLGADEFAGDLRRQDGAYHAPQQQPAAEDQQRQEARQGGVAIADAGLHGGQVAVGDEVLEPGVDPGLYPVHRQQQAAAGRATVGQVGGQDPFRFHQGEGQAEDHHPAGGLGEAGKNPLHEQGRGEGDDGGQDAERGGSGHPLYPGDDIVDVGAVALLLGVGALAHDDGVVHHDAQHQDEAEQADHVQAGVDPGRVDHRHGAEEAHRDADHHPEGQLDLQEQGQDDKHQQGAQGQVAQHHAQAAVEVVGDVRPDVEGHRLGQAGALALHVGAGGCRGVHDVLFAGGEDLHPQGVLAVEAGKALALLEGVGHGGDVTQQQLAAVGPAAQYDALEVLLHVGLALDAQQDIPLLGADRAGRQIEGGAGHRVGDVLQAEAMLAQHCLRDLDADFRVAVADHFRGGHFGKGQQLAAGFLGEGAQAALVEVPRELQGDRRKAHLGLADDGALGIGGKVLDRVYPALHVAQQGVQVGAVQGFDHDPRHGLERVGFHPLDPVEVVDRLLDLQHDALLHLFRRGTGVGHGDRDHVHVQGGKHGPLNGEGRAQADHQDNHHQQVGGDRVVGKPGNDAPGWRRGHASAPASVRSAYHCSLGWLEITSTRAPVWLLSSRLRMTRSPAARPSVM